MGSKQDLIKKNEYPLQTSKFVKSNKQVIPSFTRLLIAVMVYSSLNHGNIVVRNLLLKVEPITK